MKYPAWLLFASGLVAWKAQSQDCVDIFQIDPNVLCPAIYIPVCGCDGVTYSNECEAYYYGGVTFWSPGVCADLCVDQSQIDPNVNCPALYDPVCGCDGVTYINECEAINYGGLLSWTAGPCVAGIKCLDLAGYDFGDCDFLLGYAYISGACTPITGCGTIAQNGLDYDEYIYGSPQECEFACGNVANCVDPDNIDPEVPCIALYDPVCGCDGLTYYNSCYAFTEGGVTSWTPGPCPFLCVNPELIDPNALCPDVWLPVCGCDGITYSNVCEAVNYGGLQGWTEGVCADSDGDGVADIIDCEPFDPFVYPGASCDDGNGATQGDSYDECCECVGIPLICPAEGPCEVAGYEEGPGCVVYDVSITAVEVLDIYACQIEGYAARLLVTVASPEAGGWISSGNALYPVSGEVFEILAFVNGEEAFLERRTGDPQNPGCVFALPTPADLGCPVPVCPADIDNDGLINTNDLLLLLAAFGTACN